MFARVISIGTLAANPLWNESGPARTGHATTSLVQSGDAAILVDPGLPAPAIAARLHERTGLEPKAITHVFLTSFHPDCRRGIDAFPDAELLLAEAEREFFGTRLLTQLQQLVDTSDEDDAQAEALADHLRSEIAVLQRARAAPDKLADRVDLFPLPGVTPGLTGLLLAGTRHTTVITGDAIPTAEHLDRGMVAAVVSNLDQAKESFREAVEIADMLILGRDNLVPNPVRRAV